MNKRQLILVAGTLVLAAACGQIGNPLQVCETNEETGETFCQVRPTTEPGQVPAPTVGDTDEP
jgi:hypothetical protein